MEITPSSIPASEGTLPNSEALRFGPELAIAISMRFRGWYPGGQRLEDDLETKESKVRGDAALLTFAATARMGCQIVAVDGGSSGAFLDELAKLGIEVEQEQEKGYSAGRRQSYETTSSLPGVKVILSTEAEKPSMLLDPLTPEAVRLIADGEADLVIFKRDEASWATIPAEQAAAEQRGIRLWNKLLKDYGLLGRDAEDLDAWFGPRLIRNDPGVLRLFMEQYSFEKRGSKKQPFILDTLPGPDAWVNSLFFPIIAALHSKLRVKSFTVPYRHPQQQTSIEMGHPDYANKRLTQLRSIISLTTHYIRMIQDDTKKGRLKQKQPL